MRYMMLIAAAICAMALNAAMAAEKNLVAHYSFDEGKGDVATDDSGHGFNGKIEGAVYVKSPRGFALKFDGKDDVVTYGKAPDMIVEGDITLLAWVKTDAHENAGTTRQIFGDTGVGVQRNMSLRLGSHGYLRFEWADGKTNASLLGDGDLLDGTWKHIAIVCDAKSMIARMYIDGSEIAHMPMPMPISKVDYVSRVSGKFYNGCFKGLIDDISLYNRAMSADEISDIYQSQATLEIGSPKVTVAMTAAGLEVQPILLVRNWATHKLSIEVTVYEGDKVIDTRKSEIPMGGVAELSAGALTLRPLFKSRTDMYLVNMPAQARRIVVQPVGGDASDEQQATVSINPLVRPIRVQVLDAWQRNMDADKTPLVNLIVHTALVEGQLHVTLTPERGDKPVADRVIKSLQPVMTLTFDTSDLEWGAYKVRAAVTDDKGHEIVATTADATVLPGGAQRVTVLNNFVSELMNARLRGLLDRDTLAFMNPRFGWCYFEVGGDGKVTLDDEAAPLGDQAMRLLPVGRHVLHVTGKPDNVIARAVPALVYNVHPASTRFAVFGPHTWERLSKWMAPNCNMMETQRIDLPETDRWVDEGRMWVMNQTAAWLDAERHGEKEVDVESLYQYWRHTLGFNSGKVGGIQVDEYGGGWGGAKYVPISQSIAKLADDPQFKGKLWIPFMAGDFRSNDGRLFLDAVLAAGWPFSIEKYIGEMPTEDADEQQIQSLLSAEADKWQDTEPGSLRHAIFTIMYAYLPYCTTNRCPTADFHAHLEMQMRSLATDPKYFGLWGFQPYRSNYVDEEILNWMGMLMRHYCIEGRTDTLWQDPYELKHVLNPDFEQGTEHWLIDPAEEGAIAPGSFDQFGTLEGRYPFGGSYGDTFLLMKRSAAKPNTISQDIGALEPGRVYSLKLITADHQNLVAGTSQKPDGVVSIVIDGVEVLGGGFAEPFINARGPEPFTREHPFWMTYHYLRFRAKDKTAKLTVSDWKSDKEPGGPIGQETMVNFVELQPYVTTP